MEEILNHFRLSRQEDKSQYIGLLVAMDRELELLSTLGELKFVGNCGEKYPGMQPKAYQLTIEDKTVNLVVMKSGIGKVNAALATNYLIDVCYPDYIISTGVCGSISPDFINQKDIIVASKIRYHDVWCGKPNEYGQVQGFPTAYPCELSTISLIGQISENYKEGSIYRVPILSGDYFADGVKCTEIAKKFFSSEFRHSGVDMESGAIAQTCFMRGIKFISARIVSDCPLSTTGQQKYEDFWQMAPDSLMSVIYSIIKANLPVE